MMSWGHVLFSLLVTGPLVYSSTINVYNFDKEKYLTM
jgi:hypothetical protein